MSVYHGPRPTPTNYSKFDRIVDSDDEDDVTTRPGGPPASLDHFAKAMPPHLYRKRTEAQMAAASGDHAAALRAQQELNDELERGPHLRHHGAPQGLVARLSVCQPAAAGLQGVSALLAGEAAPRRAAPGVALQSVALQSVQAVTISAGGFRAS